MAESRPHHRLLTRRIIFVVFLSLVLMATVAGLALWQMVKQAPTWWRTIDVDDPRTQQLAADIERGVGSLLSRTRPHNERWAFRISAAQADAWLNVRLPLWLRNLDEPIIWPDSFSQLQVHFQGDVVHFGVIQQLSGRAQILTATLRPSLREGLLWCEVTSMGAGQLRLPAGGLLRRLEEAAREQTSDPHALDAVFDLLHGKRGIEPTLRLDDGRIVRLVDLRTEQSVLIGSCVTQWAE